MLITNILIILSAIILNILLFCKYIKEKYIINLIVSFFSLIALGIYAVDYITEITLQYARYSTYIRTILIVVMGIIPIILYVVQVNIRMVSLIKIKCYMKKKKYSQAITKLEKHVKRFGKTDKSYYLLGLCYKETKDYIEARDNFAKAVQNNSNDYKAYYEFAHILEITDKIDTAIIMYINCLKLKPDFYDALENLGIVYTACKLYNDAIKVYESAIKYHPEASELYYNLAMIQMELNLSNDALKNFVIASKLNPNLHSASYNAGYIKYIKGDIEGAIEYFKLARSSTLYGGKAYYQLAKIYSSKNEVDRAKTCLEYAILINPDFLKDAKTEMVFTNIKEYLYEFDDELAKLEQTKRRRANYIVKDKE